MQRVIEFTKKKEEYYVFWKNDLDLSEQRRCTLTVTKKENSISYEGTYGLSADAIWLFFTKDDGKSYILLSPDEKRHSFWPLSTLVECTYVKTSISKKK